MFYAFSREFQKKYRDTFKATLCSVFHPSVRFVPLLILHQGVPESIPPLLDLVHPKRLSKSADCCPVRTTQLVVLCQESLSASHYTHCERLLARSKSPKRWSGLQITFRHEYKRSDKDVLPNVRQEQYFLPVINSFTSEMDVRQKQPPRVLSSDMTQKKKRSG